MHSCELLHHLSWKSCASSLNPSFHSIPILTGSFWPLDKRCLELPRLALFVLLSSGVRSTVPSSRVSTAVAVAVGVSEGVAVGVAVDVAMGVAVGLAVVVDVTPIVVLSVLTELQNYKCKRTSNELVKATAPAQQKLTAINK